MTDSEDKGKAHGPFAIVRDGKEIELTEEEIDRIHKARQYEEYLSYAKSACFENCDLHDHLELVDYGFVVTMYQRDCRHQWAETAREYADRVPFLGEP